LLYNLHMPDGMSPENKPQSSIEFMKSLGGPTRLPANEITGQAAKDFPQPESRANVPDIRMQVGNGDEESNAAAERAKLEYLIRMGELMGSEEGGGYLNKFIDNIRGLSKKVEDPTTHESRNKTEEEKDKVRENIAEAYVHLCHAELDEINTINKYLEDLKNPFPYDSRWTIQTFERIEERINGVLREKKGRAVDGEGRALLHMYKRDLKWALATAKINEAMGPAYELYFDGELEMQRLRTPHSEVKASDFMSAFQGHETGFEKDVLDEENKLIQKTLLKIPPEYLKDVDGENTFKEKTLVEKAIEYQDLYSTLSLDAFASAQKNLEYGFGAGDDKEAGNHYKNIDYVTFRLMNELFSSSKAVEDGKVVEAEDENLVYVNRKGEGFNVKAHPILNPHNMQRDDDLAYRQYYSRMHELMLHWNDAYSSQIDEVRNVSDLSKDDIDEKIRAIADGIVAKADKRAKSQRTLDEGHPYDRLIDTVINSQINLERGILASGEYGWGWSYNEKTDKRGNVVVVRKSELGSIYDNHDLTTMVYWARHIIDYDNMGETRGALLFPTIGSYRERWMSEPPYWKPELTEFAQNDNTLLRRLGLEGSYGILSQKNFLEDKVGRKTYFKGAKGWQEQKYGKFDESCAKYIKENAWAFVTCWLNEPGKGSDEYNLVFPVFLPTMIEDVNFWRSVSLQGPSEKINTYPLADPKKGDPKSLWNERMEGKKLSEMRWEYMSKYKYNWTMVNLDQMERWFGPMVTPHDFNKSTAPEFEKHYNMPGGKSEKEAGKRGRLGARGSRWVDGVIRATVLAQNKVLSAVQLSGVMGVDVSALTNVNERNSSLNKELDTWRLNWIAPWINTMLDMPSDVRKVKNYGGTAAQSLLVSYLQVRRIIASAVAHSNGQKLDVNKSIDQIEEGFT